MEPPSPRICQWILEYSIQHGLRNLAGAIKSYVPLELQGDNSGLLLTLRAILFWPESLPGHLSLALKSLDKLTPPSFDRSYQSTYFSVKTQFKTQAVMKSTTPEVSEAILREFVDVDGSDPDSTKKLSILQGLRTNCLKYVQEPENHSFRTEFAEKYSWANFHLTATNFLDSLGDLLNIDKVPFLEQLFTERKHVAAQNDVVPLQNLRKRMSALNQNGIDPMEEALALSAQAAGDSDEEEEPKRKRRLDEAAPDAEKIQWSGELDQPIALPSPVRSASVLRELPPVVAPPVMALRQKRFRWNEAEVEALVAGVAEYGSSWAEILAKGGFLPFRTAVDLKDKWRNLQLKEAKRGGS